MTGWLRVHDALLETLANAWPTVTIFDGPAVTGSNPEEYATVGYAANEDAAGSFETSDQDATGMTTEAGGVRCEYVTSSGSTDITVVRERAFERLATLRALIEQDPRLGALPPLTATRLVVDVLPLQTQDGAVQRLPFTLAYTIRD